MKKTAEELTATVSILGRLPLFGECTMDELISLAASAYTIAFDPGEKLCVLGGDSPECYVVAQGEASVTVGDYEIDRVTAQDVVGEKGPIEGRPRRATVTALTPMLTYAIAREDLEALMKTNRAAAVAMRDELLRRYGG